MFAPTVALADPSVVVVTIDRQYSDRCTSGYLLVDGKHVAYTLERPWVDNLRNISSIPAGTYKAKLRYDKKDKWRIELTNVPNRSNVQVHIGNEVDQSKGCVLVGEKLDASLCKLERSANAYAKLRRAFYGSEAEGEYDPRDIKVVVRGDTR